MNASIYMLLYRVYISVCRYVCINMLRMHKWKSNAIQMSVDADVRWDLFVLSFSLSLFLVRFLTLFLASSLLYYIYVVDRDLMFVYLCVCVCEWVWFFYYYYFILLFCFLFILLNSIGSYFCPIHLLHSERREESGRMILCDCVYSWFKFRFFLSLA